MQLEGEAGGARFPPTLERRELVVEVSISASRVSKSLADVEKLPSPMPPETALASTSQVQIFSHLSLAPLVPLLNQD